ncbi:MULTISPECIES: phosphogluconate dehydrogenase (NAD(+)-dependent, decarboxylating) [unclassified Janthinobacterium]|uniref:phosphogluconate dehydrogenase (NAD(+)-dependent, decarboxylating) n=1 Tax=unclassified Janthinobacterium TaxID=2610881 RepID=UPI00161FC5E0|nr:MULTISPECIES: decarboxylating 6-phosphogluconate dehydrogenase [unclassified Janthinobacterium]MBB5607249.1 6-phosphogluconate dehydrogenase [Janthinobacterium sp. S3T4]MBB5612974.1 6-phosphogluconate dehydrogenase [Janthinobacterium sp. S3M3]
MQFAMIGLGRMGANMLRRLCAGGHECVAYDTHEQARAAIAGPGVSTAATPEELIGMLVQPRVLWLMVPAGAVDAALASLTPLLAPGDIIIDGGNSYYRDDIRRAAELRSRQLRHVDVGTSGGVAGFERGYCLMIGGEAEVVEHLKPLFATLAPDSASAPRTPGRREASPGGAEQGFLHCGPHGAGHFVKMVHNGIEYGIMGAFAEGFNILRHADAGIHHDSAHADAETAPLEHPEFYQYTLDLPEIAELWRRGSVVSSWLLDLAAAALLRDPALDAYAGRVADSGEGRWTLNAAIDEAVPAPILSAALFARFGSRGQADYADKLLSAMRQGFGGHLEQGAAPPKANT